MEAIIPYIDHQRIESRCDELVRALPLASDCNIIYIKDGSRRFADALVSRIGQGTTLIPIKIHTYAGTSSTYKPKLNNADRQKREAQLQGMVMDLQKMRQTAQDQINLQRNQILESIQARLVRVVTRIGKQGHYTLILNDKSVLYVSGAIDLTQQVVAAMEKPKTGSAK